MKKIILVCGLISGLVSISWYIFSVQVFKLQMSMDQHLFFGYASMVLAFSLIFVGVKNFRDNINGGVISFLKALQVGLLITAVASSVYVAVWLIDYFFFTPDALDQYAASMLADLKAKHTSQPVIDQQMTEIAQYIRTYRNPVRNALITYKEIVPVGVVISGMVALLIKKDVNTTNANI